MQIHELTKPQLKEASIADRIKTAGTAVAQAVKNPKQAAQQVGQAYQGFNDKMAAANVARGTAQQQQTQAQAAKYAQALQRQGYTGKSAVAPLAGPQTITAAIGNTTGEYTKTGQTWTNELDQRVTDPNSIAYLDSILADQNKTAPGQAGAVQPTQAGAVQTGAGASAIMTTADVDQAIRQMGLSQEQIKAFQSQATQNPSFVKAFLKRLGLVR
jgi:hypothetical protein